MAQDPNNPLKQDNFLNPDEDSLDIALRAILYRQDCPDKMTLGDYDLGLLSSEEQAQIQRHLERCPYCRAELARFSQSLASDELLVALKEDRSPVPDPGWLEQLFDLGRTWVEPKTGRWRQVSVALANLGRQHGQAAALKGLMSEAIETPPAPYSLTIAPNEANFELELTFSPDPTGGVANLCQLGVTLTLLDRLGDFSGVQVTLQWGRQVYTGKTNSLGEVTFPQLPCDQLEQMNLIVTLPG